jgi:RNA polymerase sigma factor (sigma-70 family)
MSNKKNKNIYVPEELLKSYHPLIMAVSKKFCGYFSTNEEREDLYSQIVLEFLKLLDEYDPRKGVDIPYYLKKMLNIRVYHYVTNCVKLKNRESPCENIYDEEQSRITEFNDDIDFLRAEALASLDKTLELGEKQRNLLYDVLINKRSLEDIAKKEKIDIKVVRLRLHFLCEKLYVHSQEMEEYCAWHNGKIPEKFVNYDK